MFCSLCGTSDPCAREGCWIGQDGWEYEKARISGFLRGENIIQSKLLMDGKAKDGSGLVVLPLNCDVKLGVKDRCPHCGQFHLRPGFCQAVHRGVRTDAHSDCAQAHNVRTLPAHKSEPEIEPDEEAEDAAARRKRKNTERMRIKRAMEKAGK